ncbi:unnamed protein product [Withania somnifera]
MSDDIVIHFASNSSNQSDQSLPRKIAKLEAGMVGKGSSVTSQANSWSSPAMFGDAENVAEPAVPSDSDDDNNEVEFLIQANTQKRRKLEEDNSSTSFDHVEAAADTVKKIVENTETNKVGSDMNRQKQSRCKLLICLEVQISSIENEMGLSRLIDLLIAVILAETIISEAWEDGETLKDLNAQLRNLLETKEAIERQRKLLKKRQPDCSRFNNFQILNHRYALLNLLGKGGFSEVYKTLVHHHIVRLWEIFEIDHNTFCTVLEYCSGKDLDAALKATPVLPEREARIIIVQIFQVLVYLNKKSQRITHYDLKPGNVLFDELGVAKVTDFSLSKIVEDDVGSQGMELTSQGAGTYWYLPPECFELSKTPLISSRVDVWSAGILLYQMLFGKRPFGHEQTQERILREDTIIKARKVEFPARPAVSNEAKEFIRRCLTYNQAERPDVLTIAQYPYLTYTKK